MRASRAGGAGGLENLAGDFSKVRWLNVRHHNSLEIPGNGANRRGLPARQLERNHRQVKYGACRINGYEKFQQARARFS